MSTLDERVTHLVDWINHAQHGLLNTPVIEIPDCGRDDLAHAFARLGMNLGVEIGTERGIYAETLLDANPNLNLICVDPYRPYRGYREHTTTEKFYDLWSDATARLERFGGRVLMKMQFSTELAPAYPDESFDWVFIDGNHSLLHVIQDLHAWVPKVKRSGLICGHDYVSRKDPAMNLHVVEAIHAYVKAYDIKPLLILGSKEIREGEVRDRPRSWLFVRL